MPAHSNDLRKPKLAGRRTVIVDTPSSSNDQGTHRKRDRPLPHEFDESTDTSPPEKGTRGVVEQAARDVRRGLQDTDRRGTPSDVPGPSDDPQHTRGADVPVHGKR